MPDPKLQSYLAQHYLSGPKADAILARTEEGPQKKKTKRQHRDGAVASGSLVFRDDSDSWKVPAEAKYDEDDMTPLVVAGGAGPSSSGFKKLWTQEKQAEAASSADAVSNSEQQEVEQHPDSTPALKAGLRSKDEMRAARKAREERRRREEAEQQAQTPPSRATGRGDKLGTDAEQETVYRDRSGRRINVADEDAALRAAEEEAERRRKERDTWGQGLVQRQAREKATTELENMRSSKIERRVDDRDLNQHFKERERSDDPALAFITKKRLKGPQVPKYKGPYPPNRFNIAPGYRWDGVDRSNGFEKLLFQRKNTLARQGAEARAWGTSDM